MSEDLFKKAFIATHTNLFLAVLEEIKFENDFAAHQQFLEQQRFEAEKRFRAEKQFQSELGG